MHWLSITGGLVSMTVAAKCFIADDLFCQMRAVIQGRNNDFT